MKSIILILVLLGFSISAKCQIHNKPDSTDIEIVNKSGLTKYKLKDNNHYREISYPEAPVNPVHIDTDVKLDIQNTIKESLPENRADYFKGKTIYISFLINARTGEIKDTEIVISKRQNIKLSKEECVTIMHRLKNKIVFQVNEKYTDWGDLSINIRSRF